jgi:alpha-amylase
MRRASTHKPWWRGRLAAAFCLAFAGISPGVAGAASCPVEYRAGQLEHWANGAVFYQVFVRSFQDSDGDGMGDFNGLASRLDYLAELGVDALWLLPITEAASYHGYDTLNYDRVELDYGTEADFDRFLAEAQRRGIRVVIDLVVNHTSASHPWFVQAGLATDDSFHPWYVWREDDPGWTQPWSGSPTWHLAQRLGLYYYGLFWSGMPDLNFEHPPVRAEMIAVAKRWLERGVDGFRLDASRHIIEAGEAAKVGGSPETHEWWVEFSREVGEGYPQALFIGENWTNVAEVAPFFGDAARTQLDMNFNFDLAAAILGAVRDDTPGLIEDTLCDVAEFYPPHALDATFLANHDMIRSATQLGDPQRDRLAAALLFTLPGVPFIYYGEEIGLVNGPGHEDPEKRTPMPWTDDGGFTTGTPWKVNRLADPRVNVARQQAEPGSLWHHYRQLIALRKAHGALARGTYRPLAVDGSSEVIAWERRLGAERVVVAANFAGERAQGLSIAVAASEGSVPRRLLGEAEARPGPAGSLLIPELGPRELAVFDLAVR